MQLPAPGKFIPNKSTSLSEEVAVDHPLQPEANQEEEYRPTQGKEAGHSASLGLVQDRQEQGCGGRESGQEVTNRMWPASYGVTTFKSTTTDYQRVPPSLTLG